MHTPPDPAPDPAPDSAASPRAAPAPVRPEPAEGARLLAIASARTLVYAFGLAVIAGALQASSSGEWTWAEASAAGACGVLLFPLTYLENFLRRRGSKPGWVAGISLALLLALASFGISIQVFLWTHAGAGASGADRLKLVTAMLEAGWADKRLWAVHLAVAIPLLDHLLRRTDRAAASFFVLLPLLALSLLLTGAFSERQAYAYVPGRARPVAVWNPAAGRQDAGATVFAGQSSRVSTYAGTTSSGAITRQGGVATQFGYSLGWLVLLQATGAVVLLGALALWEDHLRLAHARALAAKSQEEEAEPEAGSGEQSAAPASRGATRLKRALQLGLVVGVILVGERALSLGPEDTEGLLGELEGPDASRAALDLGRLGEHGERSSEVSAALARLARNGEPAERSAAAWALGRMQGEARGALPELVWAYVNAEPEDAPDHWTAIELVSNDTAELARLFALQLEDLRGRGRPELTKSQLWRAAEGQLKLLQGGEATAAPSLAAILGDERIQSVLAPRASWIPSDIHNALRKLGPKARAASPLVVQSIRANLAGKAGRGDSGYFHGLYWGCRTLAAIDPSALSDLARDPHSALLRDQARKEAGLPEDPAAAHARRAHRLSWDREHEAAVAEIERAIALHPEDPLYRLKLGEIHERAGDLSRAFAAYNAALPEPAAPGRALRFRPERSHRYNYAHDLPDHGFEGPRASREREEPVTSLRIQRGVLLVRAGLLELGLKDLEAANGSPRHHVPSEARGWAELDRALILLRLGEERQALADLERAFAHPVAEPDVNGFGKTRRTRALYLQAWVHSKLGEVDAARRSMERLWGQDSGYHRTSPLLPRVLLAAGMPAKALAAAKGLPGPRSNSGLEFVEARALIQLGRAPEALRVLKSEEDAPFLRLWRGVLDPEGEELGDLASKDTAAGWIARYLQDSIGEQALLEGLGEASEELRRDVLVDAHCLRGLRAELAGELERAREHYARATQVEGGAKGRVCWRFAALQLKRLESP